MQGTKARVELRIAYGGSEEVESIGDLSQVKRDQLQHCVTAELVIEGDGQGGQMVRGKPPQECFLMHCEMYGHGKTISAAVINWLDNLCSSMAYVPEYKQRDEARKLLARDTTCSGVGGDNNSNP